MPAADLADPAAAAGGSDTVRRLVGARALRGFADGLVSVLLARYLTALGFSPLEVGAVVTGTLVGSAVLTLAVGLTAHRRSLRTVLLAAGVLMAATGAGFASAPAGWFWAVLAVAVVGTLNPSGGDVSVFLPAEQALLADHVEGERRARVYARYSAAGTLFAAVGALASAAPEPLAEALGWQDVDAQRLGFVVYSAAAVGCFLLHRGVDDGQAAERGPLRESRRVVVELAALFSLDAAGSGFAVQSLLVLWLQLRFDLSPAALGGLFFAASLLSALSLPLAARLAERFGYVPTMVFTHLPANVFLAAAAFAPNAAAATVLLLLRALLSQMDVPARQAFVMSVVPASERAAAASVTNVPRSLASASTPVLAGLLLERSTFGWPLVIAGVAKGTYDLLLLQRHGRTPEEPARLDR